MINDEFVIDTQHSDHFKTSRTANTDGTTWTTTRADPTDQLKVWSDSFTHLLTSSAVHTYLELVEWWEEELSALYNNKL